MLTIVLMVAFGPATVSATTTVITAVGVLEVCDGLEVEISVHARDSVSTNSAFQSINHETRITNHELTIPHRYYVIRYD